MGKEYIVLILSLQSHLFYSIIQSLWFVSRTQHIFSWYKIFLAWRIHSSPLVSLPSHPLLTQVLEWKPNYTFFSLGQEPESLVCLLPYAPLGPSIACITLQGKGQGLTRLWAPCVLSCYIPSADDRPWHLAYTHDYSVDQKMDWSRGKFTDSPVKKQLKICRRGETHYSVNGGRSRR